MMRVKSALAAGGAAMLLSGCGGGGGVSATPAPPAVTPTPTPTPTPSPTPTPTPTPPPTNTLITDLKVSQTFSNDATATNVSFNLTSKTTIVAQSGSEPLTIRYDAGTNSYAISGSGFSEFFGQADRLQGGSPGESKYGRTGSSSSTYLTLVTTPYTGSASNKYVGMGYLQRNTVQGDRQDTGFSSFTYGLDTPAAGVPRTGSGTFAIDVFGLESYPGSEPNIFQGRGRFDVDFGSGLFSTKTSLTQTGLISGKSVFGGSIDLTGGGRLSSSDGTFNGEVVYGSSNQRLGGLLSGRFFGPNGEEIGASFAGTSADGAAFNGSFTGQKDTTLPPVNISFAQLVTPQLFFYDATTLTVRIPYGGSGPRISDYPGGGLGIGQSRGQLNDQTSGNLSFGPPMSNMPGGNYTVTAIVAGDPNFTTYEKAFAGQATRLELYKTGSANQELALTYASFGRYWTASSSDPLQSETDRVFFVYGFNTTDSLFGNRTGTASYKGVAYGAAATKGGELYDVKGTSQISVDFSAQHLSGALALAGNSSAGPVDFGSFDFSGKLYSVGSNGVASITRGGGSSIGGMLLNFYGPSADEVAGPFRLVVPDGVGAGTLINGVTAGKRQ